MIADTIEQMTTHLEFLGYEVSRDGDLTKARHPRRFNMVVRPLAGGVLFTAIFGASDNATRDRLGYLEMINALNANAGIARFYADKDADLFIEAWHPDYYDRADFGVFLEKLERDHHLLFGAEGRKYLR